jgi:hypothetical protein
MDFIFEYVSPLQLTERYKDMWSSIANAQRQ